ncbi:MAG: hypothetical protein WCZ90_13715 [Melioribacteraceae bacterium]
MRIKSFYEQDFSDFTYRFSDQIKSEIEQKGKEYVLNVNEEEYKNYLVSQFELVPLEILKDTEEIYKPKVQLEDYEDRFGRGMHKREVYVFTVSYSFTGTAFLFRLKPSTWTMTTNEIEVDERNNNVSFSFKLYEKDPNKFEQTKNREYHDAFVNISNLNNEVKNWNRQIKGMVENQFNSLKEKYIKEDEFFQAIKVKVNPATKTIFDASPVKRKIIPQLPKVTDKKFVSEPSLNVGVYEDILKILYETGKNLEKKPSMYIGKGEEALRDFFLVFLETRYDGVTATGETFNRGGKTDILLKDSKDSSNIFVAECKIWHGISEYQKAIDQLFENYLTWRDSKVAIMIFVKNKEFSKVLSEIKEDTPKHKLYSKKVGERGESSFSYIFHLPQDNDKKVFLEIILFHFDKE